MSYLKITIMKNDGVFCLNYKRFIMIELMPLKELILLKQVHHKYVIFVIIGAF